MENLDLSIQPPPLDYDGLVQHMEEYGGKFPEGTQFSLMVPLQIVFKARSLAFRLRDYPMPMFLIQAPQDQDPSKSQDYNLEASLRLVAAEELSTDDTYILLTCPVVPEHADGPNAPALTVEVEKTLMPVKTYAQWHMKVATDVPTDFTWGVSHQPAMEDLAKAFDRFSFPPSDPSPKISFWDKIRLSLHWRMSIDFSGPVHLHLKGSRDPYNITGFGAGFVLAWMGNVKLRIGEKNEQYEVIQILSDELFFSIPE